MSQADVGQRSAHRPQCTQTSSSLTMSRPVCGRGSDAYRACSGLIAGADSLVFSSSSEPSAAIVRHCTGQTSMQASHSMHRGALKTV